MRRVRHSRIHRLGGKALLLLLITATLLPGRAVADASHEIVALYAAQDAVWALHSDGAPSLLVHHPGFVISQARISPDGEKAAYWRHAAESRSNAPSSHLIVYDLATRRETLVTSTLPPVGPVAWSPDSRRLAWAGANAVSMARLNGDTRMLASIHLNQLAPPEIDWLPDGTRLIVVGTIGNDHGLWCLDVANGDADLLTPLADDGPHPASISTSGQIAYYDRGRLWLLSPPTDAQARERRSLGHWEPPLIAIAFDALGDHLACVAADGRVTVIDTDGATRRRLPLDAPIHDVLSLPTLQRHSWLLRSESSAGAAFYLAAADSDDIVTVNMTATPLPQITSALQQLIPAAITDPGHDFYRYQGAWDSGSQASNNCGPTCVAMAIQFAGDNLWVAISDIRGYIGGSSWTYPSQLQAALNHWGVASQALTNEDALLAALANPNQIVLVHLYMNWFPPGSDYLWAYSDPSKHYDRYYSYASSHWIVVRGLSADGHWAICHDPNVWDGNGSYWYGDGSPKGKDRHYALDQLLGSARAYDYQAIAVSGVPDATPTATTTMTPACTLTPTITGTATPTSEPTLPQPTPSATWSAYPGPEQSPRIHLPLIWSPSAAPPATPTPTHTPSSSYPEPTPSPTAQPTDPAAEALIAQIDGSGIIYSYDGTTYLGLVSSDSAAADSIINPDGVFGRGDTPDSIHNRQGAYGSLDSDTSAYAPDAQRPPIIWHWQDDAYVLIAHLTVNPSKMPHFDPDEMLAILRDGPAQTARHGAEPTRLLH